MKNQLIIEPPWVYEYEADESLNLLRLVRKFPYADILKGGSPKEDKATGKETLQVGEADSANNAPTDCSDCGDVGWIAEPITMEPTNVLSPGTIPCPSCNKTGEKDD